MPPLSATQLCAKLAITARVLGRLIKEGLPHTGRGRHRRFEAAAVAAWLQQSGHAQSATPLPAQVVTTRAEAANLLEVNLRTLATWLTDPTFPGKAGTPGRQDGYFPVAAINAWRAQRFGADHRSAAATDEVASAKLRKTLIEIDREQYEFEKEVGTILDYETTARTLERGIATARAQMEQAPDKVEARLPAKLGPKTRRRIRRAIEEVFDQICETLADAAAGDTDEVADDGEDDPADVPTDAGGAAP